MLKIGGMIILTIHGEIIFKRCKDEEDIRQSMYATGRDYEELCKKFYDNGHIYYSCYDHKQLSNGGLDSNVLGLHSYQKNILGKNGQISLKFLNMMKEQ